MRKFFREKALKLHKLLSGYPERTWDFEGRCTICKEYIDIYLKVVTQHEVVLMIEPCSKHPKESFILWPQERGDVIRIN